MDRNPFFRLLAGVLGLSAGLATPASTLAHAVEHGRSSAHTHHHVASAAARAVTDQHRPAMDDGHAAGSAQNEDHPHALLDAGLTARVACDPAAVVSLLVVLFADPVQPVLEPALLPERDVPIHRAAAPPPPSRAPPLA